ncbi:adenosine deaminase [Conyzicola lurida]|uniref:Adenine deaminase n=1 Tax=Conyzicola lurida TaxID=1172621 RepID=A0A841AIR1_9MICO|nr:adenosine deaminase [Conyzicola lurida]
MLPVAELHMHIEGSLEAELVVALARRNGIDLPTFDPAELKSRYRFTDLQSFLDIYYDNLAVLRTKEDFYDLGSAYLARAAAAGVRRAEMFFDLQTHTQNGIAPATVFGGLTAAIADATAATGISADLILCFLRHLGGDAATETLRSALPFRDQFIGVGLDSSELGFPPSLFTESFGLAAAEGLHRVAHAGEEGGPDYVWEALDLLGVERIDHGNRAMEDADLVARLRDEQIPLTVCPLSNIALKTAPPELADHLLPAMLAEGLLVSINSDDPAYFGGYVDDNYAAIETQLSLTPAQLGLLAENSFTSSFLPEAEKEALRLEVRAAVA